MSKRFLVGLLVAACCLMAPTVTLAVPIQNTWTLYNVDLQPSGCTVYSGIHPNSAAADTVFNQGSVWNGFNVAWAGGLSTNPSLSPLVDSDGNSTSVGFAMTGSMAGYSSGDSDSLRRDFIYLDPNYATSSSVAWQFTGLGPDKEFKVYIHPFPYDPNTVNRDFYITVDTDGDGSLADESSNYVDDSGGGVLLSGVVSPTGVVLGSWSMINAFSGQASWAGIQIATPEPGTLTLLGMALVGLAGVFIRRRWREV